MKIAVIGLGGVGGYLAACFAKAGLDVVGFGRGEHLRVIQKEGITIVEDSTIWKQPLEAKSLEDIHGQFDVVLFCVKSYDLAEAYEKISPFTHEKSVMLSFSNGVDNAKKLRTMGANNVLDGCIYILSHIESAGVIRKKGKVFAAVFGGELHASKQVADIFERADLRYKTPQNIQEAIWKKYIFISAFATLTSYYDTSIGGVYQHHYDEAKKLLEEIASVAKVYGVDVDNEVQKSLDTASKVPYDSSTSMHKDFQAHKKTELESLSGFICNTQEVQTHLMCHMYSELKQKA